MSDRAIREAITKMIGLHKVDQVTYVNATVDSVDIASRTCVCTIVDGHTEYELSSVRLMAVVDDGLLIEPAIGSTVKVIFSVNIEPCIVQYSEAEIITIDARQRVQFNDGSFGGMVKIEELTAKLNAIEKDMNTFKSVMSGWTPVPMDGGATLKAISSAWSAQSLNITGQDELENKKVTHGK